MSTIKNMMHFALLKRGIKSRIPLSRGVFLEVIFEGTREELEGVIADILQSNLDLL